jgi:aspartate aminotransferase-like enzyme
VTAVRSPFASADELAAFLEALRVDHGLELANGQEKLAGTIFRIGHMGMVDEADAVEIVETLGKALGSIESA